MFKTVLKSNKLLQGLLKDWKMKEDILTRARGSISASNAASPQCRIATGWLSKDARQLCSAAWLPSKGCGLRYHFWCNLCRKN